MRRACGPRMSRIGCAARGFAGAAASTSAALLYSRCTRTSLFFLRQVAFCCWGACWVAWGPCAYVGASSVRTAMLSDLYMCERSNAALCAVMTGIRPGCAAWCEPGSNAFLCVRLPERIHNSALFGQGCIMSKGRTRVMCLVAALNLVMKNGCIWCQRIGVGLRKVAAASCCSNQRGNMKGEVYGDQSSA
eukprot:1155962-Pelagomonas_calceolata.AAC.16